MNFLVVAVSCVITLPSMLVFGTSKIDTPDDQDLLEILANNPNFSMMLYLIEIARVKALLQDPFTKNMVFAPTDDAFLDVRTELMVHFLTDQSWNLHLSNFLNHHIVHTRVGMFGIAGGLSTSFQTLNDEIITLESYDDDRIVVDSVAQVVEEDVIASNGVIQTIDNVLLPSWYDTSIADILKNDANQFSTLISTGSNSIDFMDALTSSSWEPHTIFAPTNEAFSDLKIFDDENIPDIDSFLTYHMVPGIHTSTSMLGMNNLESSVGHLLQVTVDSAQGTVRINGNPIIHTDVLANNGIIHIIDGVLLPAPNRTSNEVSARESMELSTEAQTTESETDPTQKCEQCEQNKHLSIPVLNATATLLRDQEYNRCLFSKMIEEKRGTSEVHCTCQQIGTDAISFQIVCKEGNGAVCSPKYADCVLSEECCSNPLRKCKGGQCRDSRRPQRKKLGALHRRSRYNE